MTVVAPQHPASHTLWDRTFRPASNIVTTRREEGTVLHDTTRALCYTLNELGWRIWDQITAGDTAATIVRTLRKEYALPVDALESDVLAFLEDLRRASLIEVADR